MGEKWLVSLDFGSSGGRALVFNVKTGEITLTTQSWSFQPDRQAGQFAFDLGCDEKWGLLCQLGRQALAKAGADAREVAGISVTSMRHGLVILDQAGQVRMAAPNRDARAFSESMELQASHGPAIYERTGHMPSPVLMGPRLLWVKTNHPEYLSQGSVVFTISDWMAYMLCGQAASEPTQAGETCLFDLHSCSWSSDLIRSLGLPEHVFPPIHPPGTRLGGLTQAAAEALGLVPGIPVAVGGADTQLGLLGLGITQPGEVGVIAGSTTPVMVTCSQPHIDPKQRTWTGMYALPGLYVVESNAGSMGSSLEWFAGLQYPGSPAPVGALCGDAPSSPPGANGILSTLGGQLFNASALGLPVDGLTFSTMTTPTGLEGRAHLARAVLEGMACSALQNSQQALGVAQVKPDRVHLGGGMARSSLWSQILCDLFNLPILTGSAQSASGLGAAMCASVAAGMYPDLASAARSLVKDHRSLTPSQDMAAYAEQYATWQEYKEKRTAADEVASSALISAMQTALESAAPTQASFQPRIYVSANAGEEAIRMLGELGEVTYASYAEGGSVLSGDELAETLQDYQVLVTEVDLVDANALKNASDLRVIFACRGNPVNVDIAACTAAGIPVINTPGRNADAVADLAVAFMLMLARKLDKASAFLRQPGGEAGDMGRMGQAYFMLKGRELWHKTIGIVGGGAIGRKVAQRLLPFEARLLVYDPFLSTEQVALMGAEQVSLAELLEQSDFITLHAPVTDDTSGMIGTAAFDRMKTGAYLINTARAALVDHAALLAALESGKLGGAALDVFPVEPPASDDPLLAFENVIATPHIGGNTSEVGIHQGAIILDELKLLLTGGKPRYVLNPEALEGFSWSGERRLNLSQLSELAQGPGPGLTDLDLKTEAQAPASAIPALEEKPRLGGLLGGLRRLVGKEKVPGREPAPSLEAAPSAASSPPDAGPAAAPAVASQASATSFEKFNQIIERFVTLMRDDPDTQAFARGKNVTFQYVIKDAGLSFYTGFVNGQVNTGTGTSPEKVDVTIKTDAATLDGMFTGRLDGTAAFKSGKLSVGGNMMKAIVMQKLNYGDLYGRARAEVGDPGDLSASAPAPAAAQAPAPAAGGSSAAAAAPGLGAVPALIYKTGDIRDTILEINNEMYQRGWITSTGGNISARSEDNPEQVWITPSGLFKGSLRADMMVKIDLEGDIVGDAPYSASSERKVHCAIYRARPEIKAVIHTHALYATLMALTCSPWLPISADAAFFGQVPVVPFIMPGSPELGDEVARAMGATGVAAIMQNHGLVVAGSDLRRAADTTEAIEITAEKLLWCRRMGITPQLIPDEAVALLNEMGTMLA
jgi:sugar (pentulose or hexulose) kinase/phosphoglycerate dehydrogenase-like enzyme/ribulose-5-phosphate 4-epimerase/fuculose-1-phosphate aldolase/putative sterol carrier protein